jgi:CubicO group peptidase (beta-lactamase class C family)
MMKRTTGLPGTRRPRRPLHATYGTSGLGALCALCALCALLVAAAAHAQTPGLPPALDADIGRAVAALEVPGLAIAVVHNDSVVHARGFGLRELGRAEPVDGHTLFAVGSTTKAFTAAAIGMLVDEGRLAWNDPVVRHAPGFELHDAWLTHAVTVRDLLANRVGVERGDAVWYGASVERADLLQRLRHLRPGVGLRTGMSYNNLMFLAAGELIPAVTGTSWDDFIARRIFAPLGMQRSGTSIRTLDGVANVAQPHARVDGTVRRVPYRSLDNVAPAGSINSSALEMAQWVRFQLGRGQLGADRLLSDSTHRQTWTPQVVASAGLGGERSNLAAYGLGWVIQDYRGHRMVWHNGGIDGMHAMVALLPARNVGVVVLVNLSGTGLPEALALRVLDEYLDAAADGAWADELIEGATRARSASAAAAARAQPVRVADTAPALPPERYAGTYASALYGEVVIERNAGRLTLRFAGNDAVLEHWHFDTFRVHWADPLRPPEFATFTLDARARPATVQLDRLTTFRREDGP